MMAEVDLEIGGRRYAMACRDGEEAHFHRLAAIIDTKMTQAARSVGGLNEVRQFLFAALLLADELEEARKGSPRLAATIDPAALTALERLADRLEVLADRVDGPLETPPANP